MSDVHLQKRIEQIVEDHKLDRGSSPDTPIRVIVQMSYPDDQEAYLRASVEAIEMRRSVSTARALVPPRRDLLAASSQGSASPAAAKGALSRSASAGADRFRAGLQGLPLVHDTVEKSSRMALKPLLESDWLGGLLSSQSRSVSSKKKRSSVASSEPVHFLVSGSASLELKRDDLIALPANLANIENIYPNRIVRIPTVAKADGLPPVVVENKANTWGLAKTGALAAWGVFNAKGKGVKVAVLDTGVDPKHPDLLGKIDGFAEFDRDGRMILEGVAKAYDSGEHGTHCCGTIVGGDFSGRLIGMAPEARVLVGLVLKKGVGTDAQILAGLNWAIQNGAQVISMSLGGLRMSADVMDTYTNTIITANRLGIPVVVAVGNEGSQTTGSPGNDYFAFTVGATDPEDRAAGFSGGRTQIIENSRYIDSSNLPLVFSKPEVSAPGVDIYSSVPGGNWEASNGTSMATPHVAGAMAQMIGYLDRLEGLSGSQKTNLLQSLMISTVKELGESGQNHRFGYGRIDVLRALAYAKEQGYVLTLPGATAPPKKRGRK